jgi:hypothetical protein
MSFRKFKLPALPVFAFLISLATAAPARADLVLGFPLGLAGWSTAGDAGTVMASGGLATITESTNAPETDLFLTFTVPTGAKSLQFTLNAVSGDSTVADNSANGYLPDAFGASLLNPNTMSSVVPTVDLTTDSFYTRDIVQGVTSGSTAMGVTVSSSAGTLGVVSVDLSTLGLDGQSTEVLFRLVGGTDPSSSSTVTISNVIVIAGQPVVPEPASVFSLATGALLVAGGFAMRSRKRLVGASGHRAA